MAKREPPPTARLEARLPADVHALLERAAEIQGRSLTEKCRLSINTTLSSRCQAMPDVFGCWSPLRPRFLPAPEG
ncbi:MAG TPA: DUF1778 domain-containing protein [Xanthobacteraceae bacterium]|nr:DUF1778 domain-containing protein [Xanthobacteraceae bacterium]